MSSRFKQRKGTPVVNNLNTRESSTQSSPGDKPYNEAVLNRIEEIIGNALMGRSEMLSKLFDPRRDVDEECGFPKGEITPQMYQDLFDRDAIAARVVEVLPEESWQTSPTVYESESAEITQFEDTWDNLARTLKGESFYQDEQGSPIWEYLSRADKLSGIGQYGVILLGLNDGLPLNMPVQTWEDRKPDNTYPGATGGFFMPGSSVPMPNTLPNDDHTGVGTDAQYQSQFTAVKQDTKGQTKGKDYLSNDPTGTPGKDVKSPESKLLTSSGKKPFDPDNDGDDDSNPMTDFDHDGGTGNPLPTRENTYGNNDQDYKLEDTDTEEQEGDNEEQDNQYQGLTQDEIDLIVKGISTDGPLDPKDLEAINNPDEDTDGQYMGPKYEPRVNLNYIRVFPQAQAQITQYERDISSPRFGQPVMYLITFNDPRMQHSGTGLPIASQNVHWTRIIHIADNLTSSEVFGVERMRTVLNNLLSLKKLYPGSAEMYWRGAFPGYSLETNPQLGGDVSIDEESTRNMMEDYTNGLQRFLLLMGMSAKSLAPQVVDPTPQINVQIEAICIKLGIPIRVFKGSERGELASSQDDEAWNDRLKKRQSQYITPRIIVPFVDRLINIGVLPKPKGYSVSWEDLDSLNDSEKATNANTLTTALSAYISGSCESLITPKDYLVHFMHFTDEQAESMIESAKAEADIKQSEQEALAEQHGMVPEPPEGFQHDPKDLPPGIAPDGSPLPAPNNLPPGMNPGGKQGNPFDTKKDTNFPKQLPNNQPSKGGIEPGKFGEKLKNLQPKPPTVNTDQPRDELGRFATTDGKGTDTTSTPNDGTKGIAGVDDNSDRKKALKDKAVALFTQGKAKLTGVGKSMYDKLPKPMQKVVDVGQAIEHGLEGAYHSGQKLAKEVAAQRGGDEKQVERIGKWLALGDGVSRWTANVPVVHEALHVIAHIGGPVGFLGAKLGYYIPVASLGYIGYAMGREAMSKRNPFTMISKARASMQAKSNKDKEDESASNH